jgi:cytochrome P450
MNTVDSPVRERYDPFDPEVQADPYPSYRWLRDVEPVHLTASGFWVVSRFDDVRTALRDADRFSSAAMAALLQGPRAYSSSPDAPGVSLIGSDGEEHRRLRSIVNRGFTPRVVNGLEPSVRALAARLASDIRERGRTDLIADIAAPVPPTVIAGMLGIDPDRQDDFRRWSDALMLAVFEQPDNAQGAHIASCMQELGEYLDVVIAERGARPGDDLVSTLIRAEADEGRLDRSELETFVVTLLVAGTVTTTHLVGNALLALLRDPETLARVVAEPSAIPAVVEETMRYDSPVQLLPRATTADVEVDGTRIPAGSIVLLVFGAANRDDRVFEHPDRFDPWRPSREHLAFGHGPHFCLGAALARLEARVMLEELLSATGVLEADGEVERISSFVFRGCSRLPARIAT